MKYGFALDQLAKPLKFGDPVQVLAVQLVELAEEAYQAICRLPQGGLNISFDCPSCDGEGKIKCEDCNGVGDCLRCGHFCDSCDGEGWVDCTLCDGSGEFRICETFTIAALKEMDRHGLLNLLAQAREEAYRCSQ